MIRTIAMLLCLTSLSTFAGESYKIDSGHSAVLWSVVHQNVTPNYGRFNDFEGSVEYDGDKISAVNLTIQTASIDSNHEKRDAHLRKPDFFDAKQFPTATFKSTSVKHSGNKATVVGNLTILGKTKPVTFELDITGPVDGRGGSKIRGLHGKGVIKRSEYGMTYGLGGIGDEVTITVALEVVK